MNPVLLSVLIVAAAPRATVAEADPEFDEVYRWRFDEAADRDFDGWPDQWTRRHGPGFPHYNKVLLSGDLTPGGDRALRFALDGGGAVAYSPRVPVSTLHDYVATAAVKTERLQHDRAFVSLDVLDEQGHTVQTFVSEKIGLSRGWAKLRLGPVSPDAASACSAVVGLHLEPASREDLTASALFGDVGLARLPRMRLEAAAPTGIYTTSQRIAVTCTVCGLEDPAAKALLELLDVSGAPVARAVLALDGTTGDGRPPGAQGTGSSQAQGPMRKARWDVPVPGPGFYRVAVALEGSSALLRRQLALVVLQPQRAPASSEFGWSIVPPEVGLSLSGIGSLLSEAGIGWVKYPLWLDANHKGNKAQDLSRFLERMFASGIEVVGVLDRPPEDVLARSDPASLASAAQIFSEKEELWRPSLESVMMHLGTRVRWWQLGRDDDASFMGYAGLEEKIAQVKRVLDRVGHGLNVGLGWHFQHSLPQAVPHEAPWRFVSLSATPPLTDREIATYLPTLRQDQVCHWIVLEPLARAEYSLEDRAADLVRRMAAAKRHGAEGIYLSDPLNHQRGVLNEDGTPTELFLPWRTTALLLGGAQPLGDIRLPQGSTNHVFARSHDAVMMVWARSPTRESLYLGDDVRQIDLWGRQRAAVKSEAGHQIDVGPLPSFVTGLNQGVARWRHRFRLAQDRIPSVLNQRQANAVEFTNTFEQPVEGALSLVPPGPWAIRPERITFRLPAGETLRQEVEITLPNHATCGTHLVRADFEVSADRGYRFSVYRPLEVGVGDVRIELLTQLNSRGELEVHQWTASAGRGPVNLRCQLFAPGRQRLAAHVAGVMQGQDLQVYRLPEGRELLGKTLWLQAQEEHGPQVFNFRFTARD